MKPKFFLGMLLLGGLALNSCVDDTESASVQEVRQAHAEKLQSLADLKKAEAQAAIITANAEKVAQEAIDNYNRALAKAQEAEAAYQKALADGEAVRAEEAKINAEKARMDLENYAKQVEVSAAELEWRLLEQQKQIVIAKKALEDKIKESEPNKAKELQELLDTYSSYAEALRTKQSTMAQEKIRLAQLKAGLVTAKEVLEAQIATQQNNITDWEADNAEDQAAIDTYMKYTSILDAEKAMKAAQEEANVLSSVYSNKYAAYQLQVMKRNDANSTLRNSAYVQNVRKLLSTTSIENWSIGMRTVKNVYGMYATKTGKDPIMIFSGNYYETKYVDYSNAEGLTVNSVSYTVYPTYYDPAKDGFANYEKAVKADIEANQGAVLTAAKTEYTKKENAQKTAATAKETADAALKAAQAVVTTAGDNATEAQKQAVKDAQVVVTTAKADLDTANAELATAKTAVDTAQKALDNVNKQLAANKALYDAAVAGAATNEANMKAYNEASLTTAKARVESNIANYNWSVKNSEYWALYNIVNNSEVGGSVQEKIDDLQANIDQRNNDIKEANETIAEIQAKLDAGDDPSSLIDIQELEAQIATMETEVTVLQKKVDLAKAALDAAMAEDAPAE